jgi:hypothetical protein
MHDPKYRDPRLPASGPTQNCCRAGRRTLASRWASEWLWLALIGTLYASSLPAAAFCSPGPGSDTTPGWGCLNTIPWVMFSPAWWANPILLAGCLFLRRGNRCGLPESRRAGCDGRRGLQAWTRGNALASVQARDTKDVRPGGPRGAEEGGARPRPPRPGSSGWWGRAASCGFRPAVMLRYCARADIRKEQYSISSATTCSPSG